LKNFSKELSLIKISLSSSRGFIPSEVTIPREFFKAWVHTLLGFVRGNFESARGGYVELEKAKDLIVTGRRSVLLTIAESHPSKKETALPSGLLFLILERLTRDMHGHSKVFTLYRERLDLLVSNFITTMISRTQRVIVLAI
jgi:hypothetical protein